MCHEQLACVLGWGGGKVAEWIYSRSPGSPDAAAAAASVGFRVSGDDGDSAHLWWVPACLAGLPCLRSALGVYHDHVTSWPPTLHTELAHPAIL